MGEREDSRIRGKKKVSDPLKLEPQVFVGPWLVMWLWDPKPRPRRLKLSSFQPEIHCFLLVFALLLSLALFQTDFSVESWLARSGCLLTQILLLLPPE